VNGEPITLEEVRRQIGSLHEGIAEPSAPVHRPDPSALLQRIINVKLIVQEARRIGLDQLPEVKTKMETLRMGLTKSVLVQEQVRDIVAADPAEIDKRYRDNAREVKIDSLLFGKESDAQALVDKVRAGGDFKSLSATMIQAGKAKGGEGERTMKAAELLPEITQAVLAMQPGAVSAPIHLPEGFTVIKLFAVRYPENAALREQSAQEALEIKKQRRLDQYLNSLRKQYTQIDRAVLDGLDFQSPQPGLAKLRKDARVVAQVKGARPITVADLTAEVEKTFYHGVQGAIERKRINAEVPHILDRVLLERVTLLEAKRLKIEQSPAFRGNWQQRTDSLLFDSFVKKVVNPSVKPQPAALKAYYEAHLHEYTAPEMMRLENLAFPRKEDATAALEKLRKGADLKWMRANTRGLASAETPRSLPDLKGELLVTATLPEDVRKTLAGAAPGEFRFYSDPKGPFQVLAVREVVPAKPQPFDAVKSDVAAKVADQQRKEAVEDWAAKLRKASKIDVFAQGAGLNDMLGLKSGSGP
jgi:parvulin-like peptidyl-prolyl isomerase